MAQKLLHYEVIESLGEGARSKIYAVRDPNTRQIFALKHVVREDAKDIRFIEQMETEFELCRQFTHANLRRAFDLKIVKTMLLKVSEAFMVMEYVEGKALDVKLPPTMMGIVDTFIQVAQGMRAMHQMGYAHCDMKPNNILLSPSGLAKVIDYGQSCKIGTIKERIQGTPDFIAPEQVARRPVTVQTDVFNLGATLYWCLTGRHIPTLYTVNKKGENSFLLDATIDTPIDLNPRVPLAVSNLVMECIATKPAKRPTDMDQVLSRLELGKHILQKAAGPDPFLKLA
ncbi:MAG TPA: serine/threonine-protein kinase [Roseimicrobium sp.]|nr:serine/threonine-protein kinase [Roseimicrobium sp.]